MKKNVLNFARTLDYILSNKTIRIMKLSICLLLFTVLQAWAVDSYSQTKKLSLDLEDATVEQALQTIEEQSEFFFLLSHKMIDVNRKVDLKLKNQQVSNVLDQLFAETDVEYVVKDRQIVLTTEEMIESFKAEPLQGIVVTGTITDEAGQPLPGVNVVIRRTIQGTITDAEGNYSIEVDDPNAVLVFSFVGFRSQEIAVAGLTSIDVILQMDILGLEEVIAIGYGSVRKRDLTGSVGTVKGDIVDKQTITRIDQALQGRIAGLQITNVDGAPGSGTTIRIRGGNSLNAGNEPLYVIDGMIGGGDLNTINPSDIQSIEVLKDASSTAIYGSRGSNGVILITTKRGAGSKGVQLSYNGYVGVQQPVKYLDLLDGPEFAEFANEYHYYYAGTTDGEPFPDVNNVANTDWQELMFRTAIMSNHNLTVTNATDLSNYYLSMNYFNQNGIMEASDFKRYQLRFNVDQQIGNILKIGATINIANTHRNNPVVSTGAWGGFGIYPTAPVYNPDGTYYSENQIHGSTYNSPPAQAAMILSEGKQTRGLGNLYAQLTLFDKLILKSTFGVDIVSTIQNDHTSVNLPTSVRNSIGGTAGVITTNPISVQNENTVTYSMSAGDHHIDLLGGFTYQNYKFESLSASTRGFSNDITLYHALETGDPAQRDINTDQEEWTLLSLLGRINYSFQGKYLITVTGRHDGSSRLAAGNEWKFFPSAALAWRLSEESFIENLNTFSNLKLRLSYGRSGSQSIPPYSTLPSLTAGETLIGGEKVISYIPGAPANPFLTWETTDQINIGLDAGFFNNRLSVETDFYHKKTSDLLLTRELPFQTGNKTRLENVGSLQNQGIEIGISSVNMVTGDFAWNSRLTLSGNRSEILNLAGKEFLDNGTGSRLIVGEPMGIFYGAKYLGVWSENDIPGGSQYIPGDIRHEDLNGDGAITLEDGQVIGDAEPMFYGGLNNEFTFKNLSVSLFIDFSYGNEIFDLAGHPLHAGFVTNVYGMYRDRWTESNKGSDIPRAGSNFIHFYDNYAGQSSTFLIQDGSFLRLKALHVSYKLPIGKNVFEELTVYSTMSNLITLTQYTGFTPDVNSESASSSRRGFDNNVYPQSRTITFGVRANF